MGYFFNFDKLSYLRETRPEGCILCHVAERDGKAVELVVWESGPVIVSLNLYPYNPGHLLVFPRRHVTDIRLLDSGERRALDEATDLCLDALDDAMKPCAYNIGYNMGFEAGASIGHLHLHVIPRYPREIGIAELIGGARVLVQDPAETRAVLAAAMLRAEAARKREARRA